ncbi:class I SAM-dependent methyltransferase [Streptomyces sp. NBC_01310]|uniref:class I SAM-dependent methyltransferase n=1 Tax=Streptomyces sp. NBC_01310 TaxID=2903820 RepID=UPI0035B64C50|nr:class I SAM-dependent methyltransferase [Streptomyces sp. NBC_01310]
MALFDSVADDYDRYRPGVPDDVVQLLAGILAGVIEPTVVDLGAGTGQVALALLPALPPSARLDLVDQDKGMLSAAMEALPPHLGERTAVPHAVRAEEFAPTPPDYLADLVTCCRAFHWMDRPAVLAMADRVTTRTAAFALMGDGSLWTHQADWTAALKELIQTHLGEGRRAGTTGAYSGPGRRYEDDLADSAFRDVTEQRFPLTRTWTPAGVIGYLRSTSFARPDLFTDHARFEEQALELLEAHAQDGLLNEESVFTVLLARRPKAAR